jgi:hypothetical protein
MVTLKLTTGTTYKLDANNDTRDVPDEDSVRLVGFQQGYVQRVTLFVEDFHKDHQAAIGLCPVFSRGGEDGIFAVLTPVKEVIESAAAGAVSKDGVTATIVPYQAPEADVALVTYQDMSVCVSRSDTGQYIINIERVTDNRVDVQVVADGNDVIFEGNLA